MTRTTGNSVSEVVRRLDCVKNEAVGVTAEDALELLLERADVELGTDSESAAFCRTPRAPEQSAATFSSHFE